MALTINVLLHLLSLRKIKINSYVCLFVKMILFCTDIEIEVTEATDKP